MCYKSDSILRMYRENRHGFQVNLNVHGSIEKAFLNINMAILFCKHKFSENASKFFFIAAFYGIIFGIAGVIMNDFTPVYQNGFFQGYTKITWFVIILQVCNNLSITTTPMLYMSILCLAPSFLATFVAHWLL